MRREAGSALIITVLLLLLLGVIGLSALDTVTRDQQVAGAQNRSTAALYAAEAGLAQAKDEVRRNYNYARIGEQITTFATELATQFHAFYRDARVVDPADPARSRARLALVRATQLTIAAALGLLGISAPESM